MERGALADLGVAVLEGDRGRRQLLETGDLEAARPRPGVTSRVLARNDWFAPAGMTPDGPSSSRIDACAPSPRLIRVRPISARSATPTDQRRTIGRSRRTPAGMCSRIPWLQKPRASAASLSSSGRPAPPSSSRRRPSGSRASAAPKVSRMTPAAIAAGSSTRPATPSSRRSISPATPSGSRLEAIGLGALADRTYGRAVASSAFRRSR